LDRQRAYSPEIQQSLGGEEPWYVLRNDQQFGPLSFDDLAQFARQGDLLTNDWVWKPGLNSWIAAREVSNLFAEPVRKEPARPTQSADGKNRGPQHQKNLKERAKHQLRDFAIMFFYLWVVFGLLVVHKSVILSQHQIDFQPYGLAFINALIFAKVMLLAEDLHLGRRLDDKPLIYSIFFKSILFAISLICFHIVEHVVVGMVQGRSMADSMAEIGADKLTGIVSFGIIGTVALVPFFILREISRVIGEDNFWALFFRPRRPSIKG
jgi:hypothetical protein